MRVIAILCALTLVASGPAALAADADGRFAVKSVGGSKCSEFVNALKTKDQNRVALFVGWIAGYISASNQLQSDTFDLASWQDMRTLTALLTGHCDRNADLRFGAATAQMVNALKNDRLTTRSTPIMVEHDGNSIQIYEETLRRTQTALYEVGMYTGTVDGQFGDATRQALLRFQGENKLPTSGLPDQQTLFALFRAAHQKSQ